MTVHFNLFNLLQKFFGFAKIKWSKIDGTAYPSVEATFITDKFINYPFFVIFVNFFLPLFFYGGGYRFAVGLSAVPPFGFIPPFW